MTMNGFPVNQATITDCNINWCLGKVKHTKFCWLFEKHMSS